MIQFHPTSAWPRSSKFCASILFSVISTIRPIPQTHPEEVLAAFEELGPTFIKIGQLISTRPDLVSPAYINTLRKLQEKVPADDYATVAKIFKEESGQPINDVFKEFDQQPFASASAGQCHHAVLKDGTPVVVKIQHPAVSQLIKVDLSLFKRAVKLIKYVPGDFAVVDFQQVFDQLSTSLLNEVDTMQEARWGQRFYQLNNGQGVFRVPKVYMDLCHPRILVNEAMPGHTIAKFANQAAPQDDQARKDWQARRKAVADALISNFIKQVFEDRFFHADPHPGNIFYEEVDHAELGPAKERTKQFGDLTLHVSTQSPLPNFRLTYLDFGMMGELSPEMSNGIAQIVLAAANKDDYGMAHAVLNVRNRTGEVDEQAFTQNFSNFVNPYLHASLAKIDMPQMIFAISQLCQNNHLQLKPEVTLLFKAFGTLESLVAKLEPDISLMEVARPFALHWLREHFDAREQALNYLQRGVQGIEIASRLPQKADRVLDQLMSGNNRLNLHYVGQSKVLTQINALLNRLLIVIMLASLILSSSILVVGSHDHPFIYKLGVAGWIIAIAIAVILVIMNVRRSWQRRHR